MLSRLDGKPECEAKTMIRQIGGTVLIAAFTLMASGCAYVGPSNAHVHPNKRISCSMGQITGSQQPAWRCLTAYELHTQNEAAREFMLSARRGTTF
jgi:hypothetical protein